MGACYGDPMGILWVFYYYYLEKTPCLLSRKDVAAAANGDITDNGFTREIKEQPELPFFSLLHLVITWKGVNALTSSSYWPFTSSNNPVHKSCRRDGAGIILLQPNFKCPQHSRSVAPSLSAFFPC